MQIVSNSKQNIDHHLSLNTLTGGIGIGTIRFLAYIDKLLFLEFMLDLPVKMEPELACCTYNVVFDTPTSLPCNILAGYY